MRLAVAAVCDRRKSATVTDRRHSSMGEPLVIAGREFRSRLMVGTGSRSIGAFVYTRTGNTFGNPEHFVPSDSPTNILKRVALDGTLIYEW